MAVRIERAGPVWTVIHSRPETKNAMDPKSAGDLHAAMLEFNEDPTASVGVLWGEGGAFCSGWDLKAAASLEDGAELAEHHPDIESARAPMGPTRLVLDKPVIAAVAGPAVAGGMELAMWCDIRVMEESAYFGVYCRRWGIPLIDGGTVRLPRLVGQGRALDIILTGRQVPAEEALRIGLCEYVASDGDSKSSAEALAHQIASFPQRCLRADRRSTLDQHGLPLADALRHEWNTSIATLAAEGIEGAGRFASGAGRHGTLSD